MRKTLIICIGLLGWLPTQAQTLSDSISFETLRAAAVPEHHHGYRYTGTPARGLKKVFVGAFLFYKNYISSQDSQSCSFTPSCSEYSIQAIRARGALEGYAASFDRLTRCHGFSGKHYARDPQTGLALDPVE